MDAWTYGARMRGLHVEIGNRVRLNNRSTVVWYVTRRTSNRVTLCSSRGRRKVIERDEFDEMDVWLVGLPPEQRQPEVTHYDESDDSFSRRLWQTKG